MGACLSLSLHRHLRELSQGLKESHWPNAQNIPELMCQGGMSIVGFPYCYVLLTSMFGDVRCNVMLWLEGWCWMRPLHALSIAVHFTAFTDSTATRCHQNLLSVPFRHDVLPCSSILSRFNIGGWCWSDRRIITKFASLPFDIISVGICQLLFNSEQLHGPVWCSGSRVKVTRAQTGLCASSSFHSCPRSQWWESEIMLGSFSFRHRAKLTHLFADGIHQAISSINWGTVEMTRMLHWRWTIQATHCRTCQCPSVLLFLLRPTCSTFCWSACSRPILTASVIFGTSNSLSLCSTRACFSLATLLSCRSSLVLTDMLAAHPAMNKTMDILCKYLCAGIWMYICYTYIYTYI